MNLPPSTSGKKSMNTRFLDEVEPIERKRMKLDNYNKKRWSLSEKTEEPEMLAEMGVGMLETDSSSDGHSSGSRSSQPVITNYFQRTLNGNNRKSIGKRSPFKGIGLKNICTVTDENQYDNLNVTNPSLICRDLDKFGNIENRKPNSPSTSSKTSSKEQEEANTSGNWASDFSVANKISTLDSNFEQSTFQFKMPQVQVQPYESQAATAKAAQKSKKLPKRCLKSQLHSLPVDKPRISKSSRIEFKPMKSRITKLNLIKSPIKTDYITNAIVNTDPFALSVTCDPFLSNSLYYDEQWLDQHEKPFIKWLNALVTPPSALDSNDSSVPINIGKLWNDVQAKPLTLAPSKEIVSERLQINHRLDCLRRSFRALFRSDAMVNVLTKLVLQIEKKVLQVRLGQQLHLDVGLQKNVMELLLSYNPLWLRLGLETIYDETIPLTSNSDIHGLTLFICQRFFKDPYLHKKYNKPNNAYLPEYVEHIKKFTLKNFFMLVILLDTAKNKKLITHDPCLFTKNAPVKESREILIRFTKDLIAGIGDITRHLKMIGYVVTHKQSVLEEFSYAFSNLGIDLRCGIRLARVTEIILMEYSLSSQLRVPPISRLNKIFNISISLNALSKTGFKLVGDISAKDIADGYRGKTLSLLWQLMFKFQEPRYDQCVRLIQKWWKSLNVTITRRIIEKRRLKRLQSALIIQNVWRRYQRRKEECARRIKQEIKKAALVLQQAFRAQQAMRSAKYEYISKRKSAVIIQRYYRGYKATLIARQRYMSIRKAALVLQQAFRAQQAMRSAKYEYISKRKSAVIIQRYYRGYKATLIARQRYMSIRKAALVLQQAFRAQQAMRSAKYEYISKRKSAVIIQRYYRGYKATLIARQRYMSIRKAALVLQQAFRAQQAMRSAKYEYISKRKSAVIIQRYYRGYKATLIARQRYMSIRKAALIIQKAFRAQQAMRSAKYEYISKRKSAVIIQRYYRGYKATLIARQRYMSIRKAALVLQQAFRAQQAMRSAKYEYISKRKSAVIIQRYYRGYKATLIARQRYMSIRKAALVLQQAFRAQQAMRSAKYEYISKRKSAVIIQRYYRGYKATLIARQRYMSIRKAALLLQQAFRAQQAMRSAKYEYISKRKSAVIIQRYYRGYKATLIARQRYMSIRKAALVLQQAFRAQQAMRSAKYEYISKRKSAVIIQRYYRGYKATLIARQRYMSIRKAALVLQQAFRAQQAMRSAKYEYISKRKSAVIIQRYYRGYKATLIARQRYMSIRKAALVLQQAFRAQQAMRSAKYEYISKRKSAVIIQRYYRGYKATLIARQRYMSIRKAALVLQQAFRAQQAMRSAKYEYISKRKSAVIIQRYYRGYKATLIARQRYMSIRKAALVLQQAFRAQQAMRSAKYEYISKRKSAVIIQRYYRGYKATLIARQRYMSIRKAALIIQKAFRKYRINPRRIKLRGIIRIQSLWRAYKTRKDNSAKMQELSTRVKESREVAINSPSFTIHQRSVKAVDELFNNSSKGSLLISLRVLGELQLPRLWLSHGHGEFDLSPRAYERSRDESLQTVLLACAVEEKGEKSLRHYTTRLIPSTYIHSAADMSKRLYGIITTSNRSIPDQKLSELATATLLNMAKCKDIAPLVFNAAMMPELIIIMQRMCETNINLFCFLCTLLWIFGNTESTAGALRSSLTPECIWALRSISPKVTRWVKMNMKKSSEICSKTNCLPNTEPDYGLVLVNKPRKFENPKEALHCILKLFKIEDAF